MVTSNIFQIYFSFKWLLFFGQIRTVIFFFFFWSQTWKRIMLISWKIFNISENIDAKIHRPAGESAKISWSPNSQEQQELSADGVSGQFIVRYDVDHSSHPNQILVSANWKLTNVEMRKYKGMQRKVGVMCWKFL